jgi:protein-tyrosine-phosphatase
LGYFNFLPSLYDLINPGVLVHRARQWDMEAKAPHTIILAIDEGNEWLLCNLESVHQRKQPLVSSGLEAVQAAELVRL